MLSRHMSFCSNAQLISCGDFYLRVQLRQRDHLVIWCFLFNAHIYHDYQFVYTLNPRLGVLERSVPTVRTGEVDKTRAACAVQLVAMLRQRVATGAASSLR